MTPSDIRELLEFIGPKFEVIDDGSSKWTGGSTGSSSGSTEWSSG